MGKLFKSPYEKKLEEAKKKLEGKANLGPTKQKAEEIKLKSVALQPTQKSPADFGKTQSAFNIQPTVKPTVKIENSSKSSANLPEYAFGKNKVIQQTQREKEDSEFSYRWQNDTVNLINEGYNNPLNPRNSNGTTPSLYAKYYNDLSENEMYFVDGIFGAHKDKPEVAMRMFNEFMEQKQQQSKWQKEQEKQEQLKKKEEEASKNPEESARRGRESENHPLNYDFKDAFQEHTFGDVYFNNKLKNSYNKLSDDEKSFVDRMYNPDVYSKEQSDELFSDFLKRKASGVNDEKQEAFNYLWEYHRNDTAESGRANPYHPINGVPKETDSREMRIYKSQNDMQYDKYMALSREEKEYVDFLFGFYNLNEAQSRFGAFLNEKANADLKERAKTDWMARNIEAPLKHIGANLVAGPASFVQTAIQEGKNIASGVDRNVPEYSGSVQLQKMKEAGREAFINGDEGAIGTFKDLGLGLVDTTATLAVAGQYAPFLYAAQAGGDSAYETAKKGGSNTQALAMAVGNATVTYLTAKVGVEKLIFGKGGVNNSTRKEFAGSLKQFVAKQLGTAALTEAGEGYIETIADGVLDSIINGDKSDIALNAETLMKHGYSREDAFRMAISNKFVKEGFFSALSEGLGGLILGGGYMGYNMYQNYKGFKNMPGNVGYDVNGQTYREDGSKTDAFDMVGAGADAQHKIMTLPDGRKYVQADRQIITGENSKEWGKNLENYINNEIRQGKDVIIPTDDGDFLKITEDTAWKLGDAKSISTVKSNAGTHIDEIAAVSKLSQKSGLNKNRTNKRFNPNSFDYRNAFFRDHDGQYYLLRISVGVDASGKTVYNIANPQKRQLLPSGSSSNGGALTQYQLSNGSLPQSAAPVNSYNMQNQNNNSGSSTQKAMPALNFDAEADADADSGNIIAPKERIAQIPKANRKMMNVWSKRTGAKILIADTGARFGQESAGAYSRSKDTIVIDWKTATNSDAFARKILTHEGVHSVEGSEFYTELRDYAFKNLYASEDAKIKAVTDKINEYGKEGVTLDDAGAEKELVADYLSEYILSSEKAINNFCRQNPSLAKNVYWSLKKAYAYLTNEEKFEEIKNIEKGLAIFEKALNTRTMGESDGVQYSGTKITVQDVHSVQNIGATKGRISINDFDSNDIKATENFARKYNAELGVKSPFFRAYFGDWRANDTSPVNVVTQKGFNRGMTKNSDTGWDIQISGKVFDETTRHNNTAAKIGYHHLQNIDEIVKNAVLLDSMLFGPDKKSPNSFMVHSLYALSDTGQGVELIKLFVDEIYTPNSDNTIKRAYKLNGYNKFQLKTGLGLGNNAYSTLNSTGNTYSVADLFDIVKQVDKTFNPSPSSLIVNDDGTPKVVYHGTPVRRRFNTFKNQGGAIWFTPSKGYASIYSGNNDTPGKVYAAYISLKNPLHVGDIRWKVDEERLERLANHTDLPIEKIKEISSKIDAKYIYEITASKDFALLAQQYNYDGIEAYETGIKTYGVFEPTQIKSATDNIGTYDKTNPDIQFSSPVASADTKASVEAESDVKIKSNKAKNYYDRYVRTAKRDFGKLLSIPRSRLGVIDGNIDTLAGEYFHTGKISDASKEALFEKAWSEGVIVDDTNTDFAKALRKDLKSSKIYISPEDAKDIPDFGAWKNKQLGNMILSTKEGYSVDSKYQELNEEYGDNYFPLNITSPSDRLLRIAEVMDKLKPVEYTLDEREGAHKEEYRREFMKGLGEFEKRLSDVSRYEKARELAEQPSLYGREELSIEEANSTYAALKEARKNYDKVMAKELLTPNEQDKVELVLAGELDIDDIKGSKINVEGIKRVVEAKAPIKLLTDSLDRHKAAIKKRRFETAEKFLKGSDFWKEKKLGFSYAANTMERTIYDIMGKGSEKQAKEFNDHYFTPVHEHEAQSIRNKNNYRQRVANLKLSQKIEKGNKTSESFAVQFLGEVESDLAMLTKRKYISEKAKARINELKKQKEIFLRENPNLDYDKINYAISEFRTMYDELFVKMNEARIRNGYAPVEYRQGYFPHFLTDEKKGISKELAQELGIGDYEAKGGIFEKFTKVLGISTDVNNLPTNIAGKTQDFKPGIKFMSEALQRKTNETDYDAIAGFDRYIESVSDVIYHTDDIQELRALERQLRYEYSEEGVKERIDKINDDATLPEDVRNEALEKLYERNITKHGGLAQELSEYTNLLANKKSKYDRNVEGLLNRKAYNVLNWANKNVAGNMIAGNLSSAATNFIPITQASAECSNVSIIKAAKDTVKNFLKNDGFESASTFLTNRKGSDLLTKSTSTRISDVLSSPMAFVDNFTANVVTRAKYYENIKNGMSEADAIKDADRFAAGLIADRSKGALPTIFGAKNPLFKTFTMFQVEVNNQYGYLMKDLPREKRNKAVGTIAGALPTIFGAKNPLFKTFTMFQVEVNNQYGYLMKDLPREKRNKAVGTIAGALLKYFLGAYVFNDIYEKLVGRRPALDAIGFANEISGDLFGGKLNNSIDIVKGLSKGDFGADTWFDTPEKKQPSEALKNIASNVAEDTPFIGGLMGGGRVPISSALPDFAEVSKLLDSDVSGKKKADIALKEGSKALYGIVPFGLNQAKKTHQGISTVKKGGSYSINNKGEKQIQYPVYNDTTGETVRNYVQGALFGKSALPEAQEWRKNGYKSMSVKDTERYEKVAEKGKREETHNTLKQIGKIEPIKNAKGEVVESESRQRYELIQNANIPEGQKAWLELSYWGKEAKAKADKAKSEAGISDKSYVDAKYKYSDDTNIEKYKTYLTNRQQKIFELTPKEEEKGDYKKFSLFNEKGLSAEQKRYLEKDLFGTNGRTDYTNEETFYLSLLSDAQNAKFKATENVLGVNAELYYTYLKIAGSGKKDEKKANLQKYGMSQAQADAFYDLAIKNRKAGDVHEQTAYANLIQKEQAAFNLLERYVDIDAAEFSVFVRATAGGKTEKEKAEILCNYSLNNKKLTEKEAKVIARLLTM